MVFSKVRFHLLDSYRQAKRFLSAAEEYRLHVRKDGKVVHIPHTISFISPNNW